jgi:homoserine kinase
MRARVPASSANLGPGYDALGLALELYCEVTVEPASRFELTSEGEGAELPTDASHLAARVVTGVLGHDSVAIKVTSAIPLARGLGSSAALAVAAAAAAGAADPLEVGASIDGHAENAGASMLGGLVAATIVGGKPIARRLPLDRRLGFVLLVPDLSLETKAARAVLPETVPLSAAASNLGRMGLLLAGLADREALVKVAGHDLLHQPARTALYPEAPELLARLERAGAAVATWSGAGPSLLGVCADIETAKTVARLTEGALEDVGLSGRVLVVSPDMSGLRLQASEGPGTGPSSLG